MKTSDPRTTHPDHPNPHREIIQLERLPNGDYLNWGRHGPNTEGPALYYRGEAARVLEVIFGHRKKAGQP